MKLSKYNEKFLEGDIDDDYVEVRTNNMTNLQCDDCNSDLQQKNKTIANSNSFLRLMRCLFCHHDKPLLRRTKYSDAKKYADFKDDEDTK